MKDQNTYKQDSKKRFFDHCFILLLSVTLCVIGKEALQFVARLLRTGLYAAFNGFWTNDATLMVRNFCPIQFDIDYILHMCLEGIIWGVVALYFWNNPPKGFHIGRKTFRNGYWAAFYTFLLMVVSLEVVSYLAYLFQFVCDAAWAGITSAEPSLTLRNIVSFKRWGDVDWIARMCESYVFCRIWFWSRKKMREHDRKVARQAKRKGAN